MSETRRRKRRRKRLRRRTTGCLFAAILLAVTVVFLVGNAYENRGEQTERGVVGDQFDDVTVEYRGKTYRDRKDEITTVLFMGVDQESDDARGEKSFRNGGQSDFLLLVLIDEGREQIIPLQIDRDTIAEITILGVLGNYAGTRETQICLSHGFGDGGAQSCEFTAQAVSRLLYGVDIDFYVAMNLDGISALNDALGGITVTLEDDFTAYDPTMTPGTTLTLHGDQAEYYVRSRYYIGEQTNASRMIRQRNYMNRMASVVEERERENKNYVGELFDELEPYLTTNMRRGRMINEAWKARDYVRRETIAPEGSYGEDSQGFVAFYADEEALRRLVLELFCEPVEAAGDELPETLEDVTR